MTNRTITAVVVAIVLCITGISAPVVTAQAPPPREFVPVEIAAGVTIRLPYPSLPGEAPIVEDAPGHYVIRFPTPPASPSVPPTYAGERPVTTRSSAWIARALGFWSSGEDRSLRPVGPVDVDATCPEGVVILQVPTLANAWGLGGRYHNGTACRVWLSDDLVTQLNSHRPILRGSRVDACTALVHEIGHALGLAHTQSGVMAGDDIHPARAHAWAPFFCRVWARYPPT